MPAATVLANPNGTDMSYGYTDAKEFQNRMALTGDGKILKTAVYKATIDPANLTDGTGETQQITGCTGVILGRSGVRTIINPNDTQDITVTGYVQADGVVELRFQNEGAATVNLASGVYFIIVDTVTTGL